MENNINIKTVNDNLFGTREFKIIYFREGEYISPWHDIRYNTDEKYIFNYVNEIPRWTREKMEMIKEEKYNPIRQDLWKNGQPRYFKYGPIPFNYGCIPQTWEDPEYKDKLTECYGDDDPIDVIEISDFSIGCGKIEKVKVLGILMVIDEGQTDWKVIVISEKNKEFNDINTLEDVKKDKLGLIVNWFENYKTVDGKPPNVVKDYYDRDTAVKVINGTHYKWKKMKK